MSGGEWAQRFRRWALLPIRRRVARYARVPHNGQTLVVDTCDPVIGSTLYVSHEWEPNVTALFPRLDLAGKVAIDIGANLGVYTLSLSRATGPSGRVLAFEPETNALGLLRRNVALNDAKNVTVVPVALGERKARARLAKSAVNFGNQFLLVDGESTTEEVEEVDVETLDAHCRDLPSNSIGLIKIDVQGYEAQVLRGAEKTLDANPDAWIILEVPAVDSRRLTPAPDLVRSIVEQGFRGFEIYLQRLIPLLEPDAYSLLFSGDINILLTRNEARLRALIDTFR